MSQVSRIPFRWQPLAVGLTATLLASCGGGGGSPTPSPAPPANRAPSFTSGTTASTVENATGTVYTATATDADGDALTFSIAGGADASAFTLSGGALSFASAPNFDAFADADNDNVYTVNLQVSDGRGGTATRTIDVTVTNDREGVKVTRIATGFDDPVGMSLLFGRILVVAERDGTVWGVDGRDGSVSNFADVALPPGGEVLDIASETVGAIPLLPAVIIRDPTGLTVRYSIDSATPRDLRVATGAPDGARAKISYSLDGTFGGPGKLVAAIGDPSGQRSQGSSNYGKVLLLTEPGSTTTGSANVVATGIRQPGGFLFSGAGYFSATKGEVLHMR